jgi:hypothetical protein
LLGMLSLQLSALTPRRASLKTQGEITAVRTQLTLRRTKRQSSFFK